MDEINKLFYLGKGLQDMKQAREQFRRAGSEPAAIAATKAIRSARAAIRRAKKAWDAKKPNPA